MNGGDIEACKVWSMHGKLEPQLALSHPLYIPPMYRGKYPVAPSPSYSMVPSSPPLLLLLPLALTDYGPEHPWEHNPYSQTNLYDYPDHLQSDEYYYNYFPNSTYANTIASAGGRPPIRRTIGSLVDDIDISATIGGSS